MVRKIHAIDGADNYTVTSSQNSTVTVITNSLQTVDNKFTVYLIEYDSAEGTQSTNITEIAHDDLVITKTVDNTQSLYSMSLRLNVDDQPSVWNDDETRYVSIVISAGIKEFFETPADPSIETANFTQEDVEYEFLKQSLGTLYLHDQRTYFGLLESGAEAGERTFYDRTLVANVTQDLTNRHAEALYTDVIPQNIPSNALISLTKTIALHDPEYKTITQALLEANAELEVDINIANAIGQNTRDRDRGGFHSLWNQTNLGHISVFNVELPHQGPGSVNYNHGPYNWAWANYDFDSTANNIPNVGNVLGSPRQFVSDGHIRLGNVVSTSGIKTILAMLLYYQLRGVCQSDLSEEQLNFAFVFFKAETVRGIILPDAGVTVCGHSTLTATNQQLLQVQTPVSFQTIDNVEGNRFIGRITEIMFPDESNNMRFYRYNPDLYDGTNWWSGYEEVFDGPNILGGVETITPGLYRTIGGELVPLTLDGDGESDTNVAVWAQEDTIDLIPSDKLPQDGVARDNLTPAIRDELDAAATLDNIADWAEEGNTDMIPASKLPESSTGGGSGEPLFPEVSQLPVTGEALGQILYVNTPHTLTYTNDWDYTASSTLEGFEKTTDFGGGNAWGNPHAYTSDSNDNKISALHLAGLTGCTHKENYLSQYHIMFYKEETTTPTPSSVEGYELCGTTTLDYGAYHTINERTEIVFADENGKVAYYRKSNRAVHRVEDFFNYDEITDDPRFVNTVEDVSVGYHEWNGATWSPIELKDIISGSFNQVTDKLPTNPRVGQEVYIEGNRVQKVPKEWDSALTSVDGWESAANSNNTGIITGTHKHFLSQGVSSSQLAALMLYGLEKLEGASSPCSTIGVSGVNSYFGARAGGRVFYQTESTGVSQASPSASFCGRTTVPTSIEAVGFRISKFAFKGRDGFAHVYEYDSDLDDGDLTSFAGYKRVVEDLAFTDSREFQGGRFVYTESGWAEAADPSNLAAGLSWSTRTGGISASTAGTGDRRRFFGVGHDDTTLQRIKLDVNTTDINSITFDRIRVKIVKLTVSSAAGKVKLEDLLYDFDVQDGDITRLQDTNSRGTLAFDLTDIDLNSGIYMITIQLFNAANNAVSFSPSVNDTTADGVGVYVNEQTSGITWGLTSEGYAENTRNGFIGASLNDNTIDGTTDRTINTTSILTKTFSLEIDYRINYRVSYSSTVVNNVAQFSELRTIETHATPPTSQSEYYEGPLRAYTIKQHMNRWILKISITNPTTAHTNVADQRVNMRVPDGLPDFFTITLVNTTGVGAASTLNLLKNDGSNVDVIGFTGVVTLSRNDAITFIHIGGNKFIAQQYGV